MQSPKPSSKPAKPNYGVRSPLDPAKVQDFFADQPVAMPAVKPLELVSSKHADLESSQPANLAASQQPSMQTSEHAHMPTAKPPKGKGIVVRKSGTVQRRVQLHLPQEIAKDLAIYCATEGLDMSQVAAEALALYLKPRL